MDYFIKCAEALWLDLQRALWVRPEVETAAALFVKKIATNDGVALVVKEMRFLEDVNFVAPALAPTLERDPQLPNSARPRNEVTRSRIASNHLGHCFALILAHRRVSRRCCRLALAWPASAPNGW